ncbi:MAG: hypothetical protein WCA89_10065 [Terracidiphilus sp.]
MIFVWEKSTDERRMLMADYSKLADNAKLLQEADRRAAERHKSLKADPCDFFEKVRTHLIGEMNKANVELRKRGADVLDRNHMPGFSEEIFLTYGTSSLCRVGLDVHGGACRITDVISGPPNGYVISRKEYLCNQDESCKMALPAVKEGASSGRARPARIAVDIIAGILLGKFV